MSCLALLPLLLARLRRAVARGRPGLLALAVLAAGLARAENVYIMQFGLQGIYSVDVVNGGPATLLTAITPPSGAEGYTLAVRPGDGMLFYLDSNGANPNLWRWNPDTPTVPPVLVGTPGAPVSDVVRLGFDAAGNLLAMHASSSIWTLDPATGGLLATTPLSGDVPAQSGDLCLNSSTGVLYMVASQQVYTLTAAGVSTLLGTVTEGGAPIETLLTGCAFTRDGTLLVSRIEGGSLRRVNLASLAATPLPVATGVPITGYGAIGDLATAPIRIADLRLAQAASTTTPGSTVSFTITVSNDGPRRAADVRVLDVLPAGLTLASTTPSQGTYFAAASGSIPAGTWRVGALQPGSSATLVIHANVTGAGPITNTAQVSYSDEYDPDSVPNNGAAGEDDQASVTVTPGPDLRLAKAAAGSFVVGSNGQYTLTVGNTGPRATTGSYTVTDVLPAGLAFVSAAGTGWSCGHAGGTVTCTSSTVIAAGATSPNAITLTVLPSAPATPQVTNTASVAGGGETANNAGNNDGSTSTPVCDASCADLRVNKTLSTASLTVGSTTSIYTLSVTNTGAFASSGTYALGDTLPAGLTLNAAPTAGAGWSCPAGAPTTNVFGGTIVSCTRSTALAAGATSTTVTFPVRVANAAAPQVTNTASVAGGGEPAATQGNNSTSLTTPVIDFDLTVSKTKTGTPANFVVGATTGSYTFRVGNAGGRATTGSYTFTDTLPAGLTIRTTSGGAGWSIGSGWSCPPAGNTNTAGGTVISCTRSTAISAGANSTSVRVPIAVAAAAAPSVTNTATVSGANEAAALAGNNASTLVTPVDAPDLVVTKSHNGTFAIGATEAYTIIVTNVGDVPTTAAVTMVDTLPAGLTFVSTTGTGAGWACGYAAPDVTCTRGAGSPIDANTSAPPIVVNVQPTVAGTVVNPVQVAGGGEPAALAGNNTASDTATVGLPPVLAKSFSPATITVGGTATLALTVTNPAGSGLASMTGLGFTDPFPAGLSVANPPGLVNTCGGTVTGSSQGDTTLALAGGATGGPGTSCQVQIRVTATTAGSKANTTSEVASTNGGVGNAASATLAVNAPGAPVLTKVSAPGVVGVGETAILTFTVTNRNAVTNNIAFRDTFDPAVDVAAVFTSTGCSRNNSGGAAVITATVGSSVVNVTGLDLNANEVCTIRVPVRSNVAGAFANTSANITNVAGGLNYAGVNDVLEVQPVTLTKAFTPSTITAGATATMALVLTNGAGLPEQNAIAFTETLPANVTLAAAPAASQCAGTVTGSAGGSTLAVSGATLAAGQAGCTVTAVVTSTVAGTYNNAAGNISGASANLLNSVAASLTVTVPLPTLAKTNAQASISPGDTSTYVITVGNGTGVTFSGGSAVVLGDPAVANLAVTGAACAALGGAACPAQTGAALVAALQGAGATLPTLPPGGTATFTLQAQLTGNPAGSLVNTATASTSGGSVSAADTDAIVYPGLVNTKTAAVLRDPVNGTTNPKNIPEAEVLYTILVTNTGAGRVDADTVQIVDPIPANTALFVGDLGASPAGPVGFTDSGSGLSFTFTSLAAAGDDVEFFDGTSWGYVPQPIAGYDANVRQIRLRPKGRFAGWSGSGPYPSFTLVFKIRLN